MSAPVCWSPAIKHTAGNSLNKTTAKQLQKPWWAGWLWLTGVHYQNLTFSGPVLPNGNINLASGARLTYERHSDLMSKIKNNGLGQSGIRRHCVTSLCRVPSPNAGPGCATGWQPPSLPPPTATTAADVIGLLTWVAARQSAGGRRTETLSWWLGRQTD